MAGLTVKQHHMAPGMNTVGKILSLLALLCAGSCSRTPDASLVGRWREVGTSGIVAFQQDGTVEVSDGDSVVSGKFTLLPPDKLKLDLIGKGGAALGPRVYGVAIAGDKMTWKDVNG